MKAHLLLIADGRSPTAISWLKHVQSLFDEVSLVSTFPCNPPAGLKHFHILPIAFSQYTSRTAKSTGRCSKIGWRVLIRHFAPLFQSLRYIFGPLTLRRSAKDYLNLIHKWQPDVVHTLRIPFEGMLGSSTPAGIPFLVATWGNDLTLHANGSWLMRRFTRKCLHRADGLSSDTHRDVHLAHVWGLSPDVPTLVVPGSGGLDLESILQPEIFDPSAFGIPNNGHWVVNPRGFRPGSVHQESFFAAIPQVLKKKPDVYFICPGLAENPQAQVWLDAFGVGEHTFLLPQLPQPQLWGLFSLSAVMVSPSSHDGTPNSLLEAMAAGCFPVAGDIESLREWVEDGKNGFLVNPQDPTALSQAILKALDSPELRRQAAEINLLIVKKRAARTTTRSLMEHFYKQFLG